MRPLRYSINVTLDGCRDHRAIIPDEEPGQGMFMAGVKLAPALTDMGLIDLERVSRLGLGSGTTAMRYEPRR
jgi:hypothetical protein